MALLDAWLVGLALAAFGSSLAEGSGCADRCSAGGAGLEIGAGAGAGAGAGYRRSGDAVNPSLEASAQLPAAHTPDRRHPTPALPALVTPWSGDWVRLRLVAKRLEPDSVHVEASAGFGT